MKRYEIESFLKSFFLFFISMSVFLAIILASSYKDKMHDLDQEIFSLMRLCSYEMECPDFKIDFVDKKDQKPLFLYYENEALNAYFDIKDTEKYILNIIYSKEKYEKRKKKILEGLGLNFFIHLILVTIMSALFSLYALQPMRKSLKTIEEFIKDILHDFNTPLSSIILNSSTLTCEIDDNIKKIDRIQQSAQKIIHLEKNLRAYLYELKSQKESFDLNELIIQEQKSIHKIYPKIRWEIENKTYKIHTNKSTFSRVVSNILENAAKYNKKDGKVTINIDKKNKTLKIIDTGKGIKNTKKIFNRFYTEDERGTGIGLHIVKKLANELKIDISVTTKKDKGSTFTLYLGHL